ncbi:MAG: response regulator [Gammaproteobacteria bacterium]|nr:response regulator [Gammaproteobacteria bacterium]
MNDILIVEDEPKLASLLQDYLKQSGYSSDIIDDGNNVIDRINQHMPQLMLLDIMLPGRDGIDILRELRGFSSLPVIMVTAKIEEIDRLLGLELGADDYICKPFSPREVVARVKAVLRRFEPQANTTSPLNINADRFEATLNNQLLKLTRTEFNLLERLSSHPGQVFSRDRLIDGIYEDHRIVTNRTVDSHIKNLRNKMLAVMPEQELIHSVYGVGYKFEFA